MDSPDCSEHIRFFLLFSFFCFTLFSCRFRQWRNDEVAAVSSEGAPLVGPDSSTVLNESEGP